MFSELVPVTIASTVRGFIGVAVHSAPRMYVRDGWEIDANALASKADVPVRVMRDAIHDKTIYVALGTDDDDLGFDNPGPDRTDPEDVLGFIAFDAHRGTVYVSRLIGSFDACKRLLQEPVRFAETESMHIEVIVSRQIGDLAGLLEEFGFSERNTTTREDEAGIRIFRRTID